MNKKNLFKRLLDFILNKKVIDLDNNGKVEVLREEIVGLFSQFKRMSDKLDTVNQELTSVIEDEKFAQECERDNLERIIQEANRKIEESEKLIEKANLEIQANEKLKDKVSEFIV